MSSDETTTALSPADVKAAAEALKRIDALDHNAECLIDVFRREGGFGKRGDEIRRVIAPSYLGWLGSADLGRIVLEALLCELTLRRARLVAEIGFPVSVPRKVWRLDPAEEASGDV